MVERRDCGSSPRTPAVAPLSCSGVGYTDASVSTAPFAASTWAIPPKNAVTYTAISLFTGAMGLDIGLEKTGRIQTLACVEKERVCCETIAKNRDAGRTADRALRIYTEDISTLDPDVVLRDLRVRPGDIDILVGGPPCQSFSTAGRRGTVNDPRGSLIWQMVRWVEALKPKVFLMENVRGLVSAAVEHRPIKDRPENGGPPFRLNERPGSVLRLFARDVSRLEPEYRVDAFEVNAVNYGAPQLRERLLVIGNRLNATVSFPVPTHSQSEACGNGSALVPFATLGDAIKGLREENPVIMDFSPRKKRYLAMVPPGGNWRCLPKRLQRYTLGAAYRAKGGRSGWWRRLTFDLPCPTVVTMPNHAGTALCHPEEVRALTLRECALVQEFPPDWEFAGKVQEQYAQVGNAVPIRLGEVTGRTLVALLDEARRSGLRARKGDHDVFALTYVRSHVRTRKWFKKGQTFVWAEGGDNNAVLHAPMRTESSHRVIR